MTRLDPQIVKQQIENLRVQYPALFDGDDDEALMLSLSSETGLDEMLDALLAGNQSDDVLVLGINAVMEQMRERQARLKHRMDGRKRLMYELLSAARVSKAERPIATVSLRKGSNRVEVLDEPSVPDIFCDYTRTPNKTRIKTAIERGDPINWAAIVQGEPGLTVRVK